MIIWPIGAHEQGNFFQNQGTFFVGSGDIFSIFKKGQGRPPLSPSGSCPPVMESQPGEKSCNTYIAQYLKK